jgi:hypothetical protein
VGDIVYFTGMVSTKTHSRHITKLHTSISNDRLMLYKFYDWDSIKASNDLWDKYNCLKPTSKVELFNFALKCFKKNNGKIVRYWRLCELMTDGIMIHRRFIKVHPDDRDAILKSENPEKEEPFAWAADYRGIIKLKIKYDGSFTSEVVFSRNNMNDSRLLTYIKCLYFNNELFT